MIHLSKISINPAAIAWIAWESSSNSKPGILIHFTYSSQEYRGDTYFFPADSDDAKTLARELKRPGWSKWEPAFDSAQ